MQPPRDAGLVRAAQSRNQPAFDQLVRSYQGMVYNVAYRILGDSDAAADATQDTFLKAYRNLPRFRGGSAKAWLLRIVTNTCYDQLRYARRRPQQSLDDPPGEEDRLPFLAAVHDSPDVQVMRSELEAWIQDCILRLPADQRITLVLVDLQGLSYDETARATGTSIGTVKSRLSRARARLRDALQGRGDLLPDRYRPTEPLLSPHA
jgi:RNA polymerase sigma-70 factor (ECF subfamily)